MFSQILIKALGLFYKLYLTNKEGFGDAGNAIYSSGFQIYALLLTISSVGVPNAVSKLISEKISIGDERNAGRIFRVALVLFSFLGFICSVFLFCGAKVIATNILQIPEAELTLQVLSPSIFLVSVMSVFRGYFNARENMKPTANSQIIEQLSKTIFTIIIVEGIFFCIDAKNKTELMAAGANIATTIATFISYVYLVRYFKNNTYNIKRIGCSFKTEKIKNIVKNIIAVCMPITITAVLGTVNKNIDSITVVRGLKNFLSAEEAKAQYGILSGKVDTLITLPMSFNIALATALVPAISAAKAKNNMKSVENKIELSLLLTILIGLPATVGMMIFASPILNLLFPNASSGALVFRVSSISIIFVLINQTINGILQGTGKQIDTVFSLIIGLIFKVIINLCLVPIDSNKFIFGGTVGAALGTVVCYAISVIINIFILKKHIHIKLNKIKIFVKPIIATLIMSITSYIYFIMLKRIIFEKLATILSLLFAVAVYILSIVILKGFNKIEISNILKLNKNENN